MICGIVAVAAVATVAAHASRTRAAVTQAKPKGYAVLTPAAAAGGTSEPSPSAEPDAWAAPLAGLAELNLIATNTDAVFVVLPSTNEVRTAAVQKAVAAAAATIVARGPRIGKFLLSRESSEYAALEQKIGTPAVLTLCKGLGSAAVPDKDVTVGNLVKAFVAASRPSMCGASGCGPGAIGCQ